MLTSSFGGVIRQAREVRGLSGVEAARAASISPAYLSKLERDVVRRPSPLVLHQLSEALRIRRPDAPVRLSRARRPR
jgi:transcriptional regulator with XRE-family HTH domain